MQNYQDPVKACVLWTCGNSVGQPTYGVKQGFTDSVGREMQSKNNFLDSVLMT